MLHTKEYIDLMSQFEKEYNGCYLEKESKDLWKKGYVYGNGKTNDCFNAFLKGYALAKCIYQS